MFRVSGVLGWTVQVAGLESWVCKSPFGLGYCVGARGAGGVPVPFSLRKPQDLEMREARPVNPEPFNANPHSPYFRQYVARSTIPTYSTRYDDIPQTQVLVIRALILNRRSMNPSSPKAPKP